MLFGTIVLADSFDDLEPYLWKESMFAAERHAEEIYFRDLAHAKVFAEVELEHRKFEAAQKKKKEKEKKEL